MPWTALRLVALMLVGAFSSATFCTGPFRLAGIYWLELLVAIAVGAVGGILIEVVVRGHGRS